MWTMATKVTLPSDADISSNTAIIAVSVLLTMCVSSVFENVVSMIFYIFSRIIEWVFGCISSFDQSLRSSRLLVLCYSIVDILCC